MSLPSSWDDYCWENGIGVFSLDGRPVEAKIQPSLPKHQGWETVSIPLATLAVHVDKNKRMLCLGYSEGIVSPIGKDLDFTFGDV